MFFHRDRRCPTAREPYAALDHRIPPARLLRVGSRYPSGQRHCQQFHGTRGGQRAAQHDHTADPAPAVEPAQRVEMHRLDPRGQPGGPEHVDGRLLSHNEQINRLAGPMALSRPKLDPGAEVA